MTTYTWIKLYIEILDDLKIGLMPDWLKWRMVQIFLVARELNRDGLLGPPAHLAWRLRIKEDDLIGSLRTMSEIGIVAETPDGWLVVNFKKRQEALSSTERSRKFRKREHNDMETNRCINGNDVDVAASISISNSSSDPVSLEEEGMGGETNSDRRPETEDGWRPLDSGVRSPTPNGEPKSGDFGLRQDNRESTLINKVEAEFTDHFGNFIGKRERQRWETLVEAIGPARAEEIASWAERKEIHLLNRGGLMDSLETAARKWTVPPGGKGPAAAKSNAEVIREVAGRKNGRGRGAAAGGMAGGAGRDVDGNRKAIGCGPAAGVPASAGGGTAGVAGAGGEAGDKGEYLQRGAAAGRSVGGGEKGAGGAVGCEAGH